MNPCSIGDPHGLIDDTNEESFQCNPSESTCPPGYFCTVGMHAVDNVCCPLVNGQPMQGPDGFVPSGIFASNSGHHHHIEHSPRKCQFSKGPSLNYVCKNFKF
jgi:hypothetical protein